MAKRRKGTRREKREQHKLQREADTGDAERSAARLRTQLIVVAIGTVAAAAAVHVLEAPRALLGVTLLLGVGISLALALGGLGSSVKPKDRAKSGNIDYGK